MNRFWILVAIALSAGCSWFDRGTEFDRVPPGRQLEVPPDLDAPDDRGALRVPNSTYSRAENRAVPNAGAPDLPADEGSRWIDGTQSLVVADTPESTYRRLGFALERVGLQVVSSDESARTFEVEYVDSEARANRPGFFSRLILRRKGPPDHSGRYRILIEERGEQSVVTMVDEGGGAAPDRVSEEIFDALEARLG